MDNYFKNCPAKMNYGGTTDYRTSHTRELHHMQMAGMNRSDDFRLYAQANAEKIMANEWNKLRTTSSCHNYVCMHNTGTSTTPQDQYNEMALYNAVKKGQAQAPQCEVFDDYTLISSVKDVPQYSRGSK
jgi:hypothetical protein